MTRLQAAVSGFRVCFGLLFLLFAALPLVVESADRTLNSEAVHSGHGSRSVRTRSLLRAEATREDDSDAFSQQETRQRLPERHRQVQREETVSDSNSDDKAEDMFEDERRKAADDDTVEDEEERKHGQHGHQELEIDDEAMEQERVKRLKESLAAAERKNEQLRKVAEAAVKTAAAATKAAMLQQSKANESAHEEVKTLDPPPLPAIDEDPTRELGSSVDSTSLGSDIGLIRASASSKHAPRVQLGDEVPGMGQLIETMSRLNSSEVLRLEREHRLDDTVNEAAKAEEALQRELTARRAKISMRHRSNQSTNGDGDDSMEPLPAGDPDKGREIRVQSHRKQNMCLTHNTMDHSTELTKCDGSEPQRWNFLNEKIKVKNSSRCLGVQLPNANARRRRRRVGRLTLQACADAPHQQFYLDQMSLKAKFNDTDCAQVDEKMTVHMMKCNKEMDEQGFYRWPAQNCEWGEWARWDTCTATCGGGRQRRERTVSLEAEPNGYPCLGDDFEIGVCSKVGCPIPCEWDKWENWGECSNSCGGGQKTKRRAMALKAANGGRSCKGQPFQNAGCQTLPCPVDCAWALWEAWADCTKTCGGGVRRRERGIMQHALFGGKPCPAVGTFALEGASLTTDASEVLSLKGAFGQWSKCNKGYQAVGIGKFQLMDQVASFKQNMIDFECSPSQNGCRTFCEGSDCKMSTRCVSMGDGKTELGEIVRSSPNEWGPMSKCPEKSKVLGLGKLSLVEAHRENARVTDFHCNATGCRVFCTGSGCEIQSMCGSKLNAVNGKPVKSEKDKWGDRSGCPANMMVVGLSQVTLLDPADGMENLNKFDCNEDGCKAWCWGSDCTVVSRCIAADAVAGVYEEAHCGSRPCPIDCQLGEWQTWAQCSKTCAGGLKYRERVPLVTPENGGIPCGYMGLAIEYRVCNSLPCAVACLWGEWGEWDDCSASCSGGQKTRRRVTAREAKYNGQACGGLFELVESCSTDPCPQDCEYGMWAGWSVCSKQCGGSGYRQRDREVVLEVKNGGKMCLGSTTDMDEGCADSPCAINCELDSWTSWSACSKDCGLGEKTRFRTTTVPKMYGGKDCTGQTKERAKCVLAPVCQSELDKDA